jgi:hypothetical protein
MRSVKLFAALALLTVVPILAAAQGDGKLPVIRSNASVVSIKDGETLRQNTWTLSPELKPDVYEAALVNGKPHKVTFITDVESISFTVEEGKHYDFIIKRGEDLCHTRIVGTRFVPAAVFDKRYRDANRGKMTVEIPEVYELVNVAIAMTPTGIADRNLVYQNSEYYARLRGWFDKHRAHPLLAALDEALRKNPNSYFTLKMNGYAFEFDGAGRVVQSKVYDRTGFRNERSNTLRPYLAQIQSFADETDFRRFYRENAATYREQIAFYRDVANVAEMKRWLDRNFPASNDYDAYKIIFSPLVAYNQSTTWFESNGFKELQPHVNFRAHHEGHQQPRPLGGEEQGPRLLRRQRRLQRVHELGARQPPHRGLRAARGAGRDDRQHRHDDDGAARLPAVQGVRHVPRRALPQPQARHDGRRPLPANHRVVREE